MDYDQAVSTKTVSNKSVRINIKAVRTVDRDSWNRVGHGQSGGSFKRVPGLGTVRQAGPDSAF